MKPKWWWLSVFLLLLVSIAQAQTPVQPNGWELAAPGVWSDSQSEQVVVRKSDGSIWIKNTYPTPGAWVNLGSPPGGSSSGPQVFRLQHGTNGPIRTYVIVRGPFPNDPGGNIWERHIPGTWFGGWSAWSSSMFGQPPGGTTAAPAAASAPFSGSATLVVRGAGNIPWARFIQTTTSGEFLSPWTTLGQTPIDLAPTVAMTFGGQTDIVATNFGATVVMRMTCQNGLCSNWSNIDTPTSVPRGSSPRAIWNPGNGGTTSFLTVAQLEHFGDSLQNIFDTASGTFAGWQSRGTGLPFSGDSAVTPGRRDAVSGVTALIAHQADGNYYRSAAPSSWSSIGRP